MEIQLAVTQTNFSFGNPREGSGSLSNPAPTEVSGSWTARCVFGRKSWLIENTFSPNTINNYYFDGTNVYHTAKLAAGAAKREKSPKVKEIEKMVLGKSFLSAADSADWAITPLTITPKDHPLDNIGANLPWLAFCSGSYLRVPGRLLPLTGAEIRHVDWSFSLEDRTETYDDVLGLPIKADLKYSAKLLESARTHESLLRGGRTARDLHRTLKPLSELPEGFLAGRYQVLECTNLNTWHVPVRFTYEQYLPGSDKTPMRTLSVAGVVTAATVVDELQSNISGDHPYSVVDYRFRDKRKLVDEIHYGISNGIVRAVTDPVLQSLYSRRLASAPFDPTIKARFGIYGLFAALLAAPVIAAWIRWLIKKDKKPKITQYETPIG